MVRECIKPECVKVWISSTASKVESTTDTGLNHIKVQPEDGPDTAIVNIAWGVGQIADDALIMLPGETKCMPMPRKWRTHSRNRWRVVSW
jgi:hypothetical protein